jgi:DNA helicase IV
VDDDGYAHVLVDEAQDLSPMQWRMIGRRGRQASWTIVGDPAQSSWPLPQDAALARADALGTKPERVFRLSTNYRNSAEIYDYAAAYASRVGLDADLPTAVRSTGVSPLEVSAGDDVAATVRAELTTILEQVSGTVAVVAPIDRRAQVSQWLSSWAEFADAAPHATTPETAGDDRVVVLTGIETKGLEFDGIVVVDPDAIEAESPTGRATLYVVLTRATQLLTLIR